MVTFLPTRLSTSEDKIFMFCNFNMKSYLSFAKFRQKVCLRGQTWRLLSSKGASLSSDWPETTARYENVLVTHLSASSSLSRYSGDVRRLKNTKELFFFSNFFYIVNPMLYVGKKIRLWYADASVHQSWQNWTVHLIWSQNFSLSRINATQWGIPVLGY